MELFDSHSHYNDEKFNEDREQIIKETYEAGVTKFVCAGYNIDSSLFSLEMSKKYEFIYSICGISPNDIPQSEQQLWKDIDEISQIVKNNNSKKLVAIGEIGLDYYWNKENKDLQKQAFIKQIELANELELPIVIHSRDASVDTLDIIRNNKLISPKKIIGLYSLNNLAIVFKTLNPSLYVLSFDTDPAGLSLYSTGNSSTYIFLSSAWIVISFSISKPFDSTGNVFTNS